MAYYLSHSVAGSLVVLASLAYILTIDLGANSAPVKEQGPFNGKSFSLSSRVTVLSTKDGTLVTSSVQESYSMEQKRARISYETPNKVFVKRGVFYLDFKTDGADGIVLHYDNFYGECQKSYLSAVHDQFATRNPIPLFPEDVELGTKFGQDFIAGPARLLFVVENNKARMKLVSQIMVRNVNCFMYVIDGTPELGSNTQLTIFYSIDSITSNGQNIPVQIVLSVLDNTPNRGTVRTTFIDYSKFEAITDNRPKSANRAHWATDGKVVFDEYAFRPASGCSSALQSSHEIDLFADRSRATTKFSFKAKIEYLVGAKKGRQRSVVMKSFVAYDARLAALRYEIVSTNQKEHQGPTTALKHMIFNFKSNLIYHAMQRAPNSNTTVDKILNLSRDHEHAGKTATTHCIAASLDERHDNAITIGRLLAGADKFVYMGRAQVRGVDAKVYETTLASVPYWLGQPIVFKTSKGDRQVRKPDIGAGPDDSYKIATTVLLYLAERDANQPLLMVEVYQLSKDTFQVYAKQTIEVSDFVWDLTASPKGDRVTELFSLARVCSEDASVYARVEMLLEGEPQQKRQSDLQESLLYVSDARNLALLAALQDNLHLSATMIFDLESRLITGPNVTSLKTKKNSTRRIVKFPLSDDDTRQAMVVSFSIAPHIETMAILIYIGQGYMNSQFRGKRACVHIRSFEGCFFLTAHRWTATTLGYDKQIRLCCMDLDGLSKVGRDKDKPFLISNSQAPLEVYRIEHRPSLRHSIALEWIRGRPSLDATEKLRFVGAKLNLRGLRSASSLSSAASPGGDYSFEVSAIRKEGGKSLAPVAAIGNDDMDEDGNDDIRRLRLLGLGLLKSEPGNRRVRPTPLDSNSWSPLSHQYEQLSSASSAMTFEQCQAACLTDLDCQSFSVCMRNFDVECVISNTSFRSPLALQQLARILREARDAEKSVTVRPTSKVILQLGTVSVELARHPNCELHNKNFLDLFSEPSDGHRKFHDRRVYPVLDQEDCAHMCFRHNLQLLRDDVTHMKTAHSTAFSDRSKYADQLPESIEEQKAIHALFMSHKRARGRACKTFLYIERSRLNESEELNIQENGIIDKHLFEMTQMNGYCVLGDRRTDQEAKQLIDAGKSSLDSSHYYFELEIYEFKADIFFEKLYGVSLRKSPMTQEEKNAYEMLAYAPSDSQLADFVLMRSFIELGKNLQDIIPADESKCALVCFLQSWGPWPACRSFDIIIETTNSTRPTHKCRLNSITLNQAVKTAEFGLIENAEKVTMWHYEPRAGFALDESMLSGDLTLRELAAQLEAKEQQSGKFRSHSIGSSFVVLLGMISGVLFGIWLGKRYLSSNEPSNAQLLNSNLALSERAFAQRKEFVNQVNSEGVIPD